MRNKFFLFLIFPLLFSGTGRLYSQKKASKKYPSLFWEITGNGLKKPSYLFGTMHVSSKMVFHLSDSFYYAMRNVDAVALELNPDLWQGQMVRLDRLKENYANFIQSPGGDFLNENSFRIKDFEPELKAALSTEPTVVNSLLYRSYKAREDFEEDTFLDLYIFQTGKKLGKRSAGVEDYNETERVVLEAYADMAREKKKKNLDMDGESMRDIGQKIQDAYRTGDLDLMDSLDILTERSAAFREKFLYKRNEIQAGSIDTILKRSSLFVGVGAAHLPGPRGIIELLRKMGYTLRPIKMADRDALKKEETDELRVPVNFSPVKSDDGFYNVNMPGPLFKIKDEFQRLDRRQYSDMSNGSYYMVTRVKTFAAFLGLSEEQVFQKVDNLLYENIPGKILRKTVIQKNGYKGFDITSRTRRGDQQRYNILVTPFEILVFKMSGKENYIDGKEAAQFFSSIQLRERKEEPLIFTPAQGGFTVALPQEPNENLNSNTTDGIKRWEYEAIDKNSGNAYLIFKKSVFNFKFLDQDSFDLKLVEESFRSPDYFGAQLHRKLTNWKGYPCLEVKEAMKNGNTMTARYVIAGPHYYCIAVNSKDKSNDFTGFFDSFRFTPYRYISKNQYVDTFLHFSVTTPVSPDIDEAYRAKLEKVTAEVANSNGYSSTNTYWPKSKNAWFTSDSTGEAAGVSVQQYPKYYSVRDSANFWKNQLGDYLDDGDLLLSVKDSFILKNGTRVLKFSLTDTGSSRTINRMIIQKDNYIFNLVSIGDTMGQRDDFSDQFFSSFAPGQKKLGRNIFTSNLDSFFSDLFSNDSITRARAKQSINNVYFGEKGAARIMLAINALRKDKDYVETKTRLIAELGYIKDRSTNVVVPMLKKIYGQTADTSIFQNEVVKALARHRSKDAIKLYKELVLQDPPFFESDYEYTGMFNNLRDSLELAATLYPELLQLAGVEDYKAPVISLLVTLVDSGFINDKQYSDYFNNLYFDARIELKKQQGKDEKKMEEDKDNDDDLVRNYDNSDNKNALNDYAILLMPFYDKNSNVPRFFDRLLRSKDELARFNTAMLLMRKNINVPDSVLWTLAEADNWRGKLYSDLEEMKRLEKFPAAFKTQLQLARSYLVADKDYKNIDSIVYLFRQRSGYDNKKGLVYFFKYRVKKDDEWKIGISGLQPEDPLQVSSDTKLVEMTDKKIKPEIPLEAQLQEQLRKIQFTFHKSARNYFDRDVNYRFNRAGQYEERN